MKLLKTYYIQLLLLGLITGLTSFYCVRYLILKEKQKCQTNMVRAEIQAYERGFLQGQLRAYDMVSECQVNPKDKASLLISKMIRQNINYPKDEPRVVCQ